MNIMKIKLLKDIEDSFILEKHDKNLRTIEYFKLDNTQFIGRNLYYPNILVYSHNNNSIYNPYDEMIMSLKKTSFYDNNEFNGDINQNKPNNNKNSYYFFCYNFDNYYHFIYDTLPYLYQYHYIKKHILPDIKLLIQNPNKNMNKLYDFNIEILSKIVDISKDIDFISEDSIYNQLYIGNSLTHGINSNLSPRIEIFDIYKTIIKNNKILQIVSKSLPTRFYVSRRSWIHNNFENIGTNYTTRRKMMNEDELVSKLKKRNIEEVFCELLTTDQKLSLFKNAQLVIGVIGGGMTNLLFSTPLTKSIIINTPYFLDINARFIYSAEHTDKIYFNNTITYLENNKIPLYTRVQIITEKYKDRIGEICKFVDNKYLVKLSNNDIAGFNNADCNLEEEYFSEEDFILLDSGLNSPYLVDIPSLLEIIDQSQL